MTLEERLADLESQWAYAGKPLKHPERAYLRVFGGDLFELIATVRSERAQLAAAQERIAALEAALGEIEQAPYTPSDDTETILDRVLGIARAALAGSQGGGGEGGGAGVSDTLGCLRCGYPVARSEVNSIRERKCEPCWSWEGAVLKRAPHVSNTVREGFEIDGDTVTATLWYPRSDGEPKYLAVDLMDVRANDGLRLHYDFERDGWVVEQPWTEEVEITQDGASHRSFGDVEHWREVGFFQAWALDVKR